MSKKFSIFVIYYLLLSNSVFAEILNQFTITGNDRVSQQTIINFSEVKVGDDLNNDDLNKILKNIYSTNFFENVNVSIKKNILTVNVTEYPIIQEIIFNGIKAEKIRTALRDEVFLKEKNPYNKIFLEKDLTTVLNVFRSIGYYFAKVDVNEEKNTNGTVNIIYDVEMGDKAKIKKIKFIGNKVFKDRKLHSVIISEESKFWKFISKGKYLNREIVERDKRLLKNFYLNKGYYQVEIDDAYSQIIDNQNFELTFKISAGKKFSFNNFELLLPNDFDESKFTELRKIFDELTNSSYSYEKIEKILDEIDKIALYENYEFIDAKVTEKIIDDDKINFTFNIKESEKFYVERINIVGNNITHEEFIRQQLVVDEGDPFNVLLHNKSINALKSKRIFGSVRSEIKDGTGVSKKIIDISVEEKPTGEINAGAGYGTSGSTIAFGVKENNFSGKGIKLDVTLTISEESLKGLFSYTNPNFAYSDRAITTSFQSTTTDKMKEYGYESSLIGFSMGAEYEQFEDLFFSPNVSVTSEALETSSTATANYKKQEGSYFDSMFSYGLAYDKRNSTYQPSDGYISRWYQELPIVADGSPIINGYQIKGFRSLADNSVLSSGIFTRAANSLSGEDVRVSKRLYIPASKLRGFEYGRVGPKDGAEFVGGNYMATFNTQATIPYFFDTFENIDFVAFFDAANVWHVDYSSTVGDSNKLRTSAGLAVDVLTPVGPLTFSLAQPMSKAKTDQTEVFRFNLGTTF